MSHCVIDYIRHSIFIKIDLKVGMHSNLLVIIFIIIKHMIIKCVKYQDCSLTDLPSRTIWKAMS